MKSKLEILDEFFSLADKNIKQYKPRISKLDKLFAKHKEKLLNLLANSNVSIRQVYMDLVEKQVLENTPYISFYQWVKRKQKEQIEIKKDQEHTTIEIEKDNNKNIKLFHGFDINKELDEVKNPIPEILNVASKFLIEEFKKEREITNELIILTLFNIIEKKRKNIFRTSWSFLMLKDHETTIEYSTRLQHIVNDNPSVEYEVLTYTTALSRYSNAANSFHFNITRRQQ